MAVEICVVCEGQGKQTVTVETHGQEGQTSYEMDCTWCDGTGAMTPAQEEEYTAYCAMWCDCGEAEQVKYYADGEHPGLRKHHWRCLGCDGVTQVG